MKAIYAKCTECDGIQKIVEPTGGMSDRYTIEELEQAFENYYRAKKRFLAVAKRFCEQQESKNEGQVISKVAAVEELSPK